MLTLIFKKNNENVQSAKEKQRKTWQNRCFGVKKHSDALIILKASCKTLSFLSNRKNQPKIQQDSYAFSPPLNFVMCTGILC